MAVRGGGGRERYYARSAPSGGTASLVPAYPYPGSSLDAAFVANAYTWGRNSLDANFESTAAGAYFYQPSFAMPSYSNLPDFITGIGGTFTRASTATYFDNTGTLQTAASGVPRVGQWPGLTTRMGYVAEELRTNSVPNNTFVGAAAGTPGTQPNLTAAPFVTTTGIVSSIVGVGVENGVTYIDRSFVGTPAANGVIGVYFSQSGVNSVPATNGQVWAISQFLKVSGGSLTNVGTIRFGFEVYNNVGVYLTQALVPSVTPDATLTRYSGALTVSNAAAAYILPQVQIEITAGAAINFTLRIGLPQLELGAFATSPIPTTAGAVARAADVLSLPTTGWYSASAGTWFVEFLSIDGNSTVQRPLSASDGTTTNLNEIILNGTTTSSVSQLVAGTTRTSGGIAGQTPINAINKFAYGADAAGMTSAANGNTFSALVSAGTMPTITNLHIGNRVDGIRPMNGFIYRLFYIPSRETNATIQALTA